MTVTSLRNGPNLSTSKTVLRNFIRSIMMSEESNIETTNLDIDVVSYNDDNTVDQDTFKKFQDKVFSKCKVNLTLLMQ